MNCQKAFSEMTDIELHEMLARIVDGDRWTAVINMQGVTEELRKRSMSKKVIYGTQMQKGICIRCGCLAASEVCSVCGNKEIIEAMKR